MGNWFWTGVVTGAVGTFVGEWLWRSYNNAREKMKYHGLKWAKRAIRNLIEKRHPACKMKRLNRLVKKGIAQGDATKHMSMNDAEWFANQLDTAKSEYPDCVDQVIAVRQEIADYLKPMHDLMSKKQGVLKVPKGLKF